MEVTLPPVAMPSPPDVAIPRGADSTVGPGGVVGGMSALDMGIGLNPSAGTGQGLQLAHLSAQPEPLLSPKHSTYANCRFPPLLLHCCSTEPPI